MTTTESGLFSRHLSAGERLSELLFGLIMTLTFTLTAGFVVGEEPGAVRELLVATIGCNIAWGIIDGGLLVLGRVFDRGRSARLGKAIRTIDDNAASDVVASELDSTLEPLLSADSRRALYRQVVDKVRSKTPERTGIRGEDLLAAHAVFWLVVFASFPAAAPFALIDDPWVALRVSNAILLTLFFVIGYLWAGYTTVNRWRAAITLTLFGMAMVATAIALGG